MGEKRIIYGGMDPGSKGFITLSDGEEFYFIEMPRHKAPNGKKTKKGTDVMKSVFHEKGMRNIVFEILEKFPNCTFKIGIEEVGGRGGWSATNNFNFGFTAGLQRMLFIMLDAEYELIRPQKWQSVMGRDYEDIKKASKTGKTQVKDPKAMAAIIVANEWPDIDMKRTERSKVVDDNKIDSFLVCNYMIRKYGKEV